MVPDDARNELSDTDSPERSNGRPEEPTALPEGGILGALPRTRPQRTTPRRAAAQAKAGKQPAPKRSTTKAAVGEAAAGEPATDKKATGKSTAAKSATGKPATRKPPKAKTLPRRSQPPAPKQGYEPEEELELGATVHPPSGVELVESVAEIFVELAGAGLKAGGRALKDVLSPLRR